MIYDGADKAIKEMNRLNLKAFNRLKLAKWDEISVIRAVCKVYDDSVKLAERRYYEIALEAFIVALYQANVPPPEATLIGNSTITAEWVLEMLEEPDPVTLYIFLTEADRKKQRLIETLAAAQNKNAEIDKALRYWTMQVGQYADNTVYRARLEAFRQAGVERVRWVTQEDNRVCTDCEPLNGQVFAIEDAPPPQHYGCRCELWPVID